jgi:hypothetical protein
MIVVLHQIDWLKPLIFSLTTEQYPFQRYIDSCVGSAYFYIYMNEIVCGFKIYYFEPLSAITTHETEVCQCKLTKSELILVITISGNFQKCVSFMLH